MSELWSTYKQCAVLVENNNEIKSALQQDIFSGIVKQDAAVA